MKDLNTFKKSGKKRANEYKKMSSNLIVDRPVYLKMNINKVTF